MLYSAIININANLYHSFNIAKNMYDISICKVPSAMATNPLVAWVCFIKYICMWICTCVPKVMTFKFLFMRRTFGWHCFGLYPAARPLSRCADIVRLYLHTDTFKHMNIVFLLAWGYYKCANVNVIWVINMVKRLSFNLHINAWIISALQALLGALKSSLNTTYVLQKKVFTMVSSARPGCRRRYEVLIYNIKWLGLSRANKMKWWLVIVLIFRVVFIYIFCKLISFMVFLQKPTLQIFLL